MVWVYQRVTYPKLSQTKANKNTTSHWLYRFRFKTLYQTVKGQAVIHFCSTRDWAVCEPCSAQAGCATPSPGGQRSWLPSHSPALLCAALPDTNLTPGSSSSSVPCHIAGCQDQRWHRHEAWPDGVYVTSPPGRRPWLLPMVEALYSVSCLCGS